MLVFVGSGILRRNARQVRRRFGDRGHRCSDRLGSDEHAGHRDRRRSDCVRSRLARGRRRRRLGKSGPARPRRIWRRLGRRRRWRLGRRRRWWLERWRRHLRRRRSVRTMVSLARIARHLVLPGWTLRRAFDAATLQAIEQAITDTERGHGGEIRFAVEASSNPLDVMRGVHAAATGGGNLRASRRLGHRREQRRAHLCVVGGPRCRDRRRPRLQRSRQRRRNGRRCVAAWSNRSHAGRRARPSSKASRRWAH